MMVKAIGTIKKRKKHAHASYYNGGWIAYPTKVTVKMHSELWVERVHEYRYFFPVEPGHACCTEQRVCLYVRGSIKNSRDLCGVERALKELA